MALGKNKRVERGWELWGYHPDHMRGKVAERSLTKIASEGKHESM